MEDPKGRAGDRHGESEYHHSRADGFGDPHDRAEDHHGASGSEDHVEPAVLKTTVKLKQSTKKLLTATMAVTGRSET